MTSQNVRKRRHRLLADKEPNLIAEAEAAQQDVQAEAEAIRLAALEEAQTKFNEANEQGKQTAQRMRMRKRRQIKPSR